MGYSVLQWVFFRIIPVIVTLLGMVLMFDQDTAINTLLLTTDASSCTSTSLLLHVIGALCIVYSLCTFLALKSGCQKTQGMYGVTMSAISGMLLHTMWEGLSTHDQKVSSGLVGGLVILSAMKF